MSAIIQFEQVSYTYPNTPQPALHNVSLSIAEGDFVLVVGTSGSGKSTFLRCINGLVPHFYGGQFGGCVLVAGRDTRSDDPRRLADVVGFVFQDPEAQMVVEVVEDELVFGMENLGISPDVMRRRVEEVLDQLEISHLRHRRVTTLSGGERQRVAIAAVLAMQPKVLVLDEPTSQLDPHAAEEVLTALQKLNTDLGLTIILSEHRLERVVQYADQLILFERDEQLMPTLTMGTPREVLRRSPLAPPLVQLANSLGWQPLPLTIKEGRKYVVTHNLDLEQSDAHVPAPVQPAGMRKWLSKRGNEGTTRPPVLALDNVTVARGGRDIIHAVSLAFEPSSIVAIMGRNGSGKTTLLRTIIGLETLDHGSVRQHGQDLAVIPVEARAQRIGYVPQDPRTLLFRETVMDELRWTLQQHSRNHASGKRFDERIHQTLAQLRLDHVAQAHPYNLSGGEQQRVALAAMLVADPLILLLDEPTRGLDYHHKSLLVALLDQLRQEGRVIVLVTHDVEFVATCADRIVLLGNGEVVVTGHPHDLLNNSLIFSSQIGKLFRHRSWLTVTEALAALQPDT